MNVNNLSFESVVEQFPSGTSVISIVDNEAIATVVSVTRNDITGAARLIIRWASTGIACEVMPGLMKPI